jgi:hypothetical protein
MNLGGSHADVIMDDCRKSQTLDSLPGKAGGLPILIILKSDTFLAQTLASPAFAPIFRLERMATVFSIS